MKKFMLASLMLMSLNGFAQSADYSCDIRRYRLEVTLTDSISTSMWLTDTNTHTTISQGYAKSISRTADKTIFSFYPGQADPMKLSFKTQDIIDFPDTIKGSIDTMAGGFILREKMDCYKR
jgi:hypothetical protein